MSSPPPTPPARPTNRWAIAALLCGVLVAPAAIVFGHVSLAQIKRTGESGRGVAVVGLALGYLFTTVIVVALVLVAVLDTGARENLNTSAPVPDQSYTAAPTSSTPANPGANCRYLPSASPPGKPVTPPQSGPVPAGPEQVSAGMQTNQGDLGLSLDNGEAPCTVNSFVSLVRQGFFDNTQCHRLTTAVELSVLQCGDPTGNGTGGPGYQFANEYPTDQYPPGDPALNRPIVYPRGTLAMANAGPGTNGSQFFLVYEDSQLPPQYTMFGTIDQAGLATLDKIAAAGVAGGGDDGAPATEVTITSVRAG